MTDNDVAAEARTPCPSRADGGACVVRGLDVDGPRAWARCSYGNHLVDHPEISAWTESGSGAPREVAFAKEIGEHDR